MRAYLVKDEGTFERLAKQKFDEDLVRKQEKKGSNGGVSAIEAAHSNSFGSLMSR